MTSEPIPAARMPFRRLVWMPWRWSRLAWVAIVGLCILYPPSAVPVVYLLHRIGASEETIETVASTAYYPVVTAYEHVPLFDEAVDRLFDVMEWLFGTI